MWQHFLLLQCAGCQEELKEGQALIALERQWHIWCFKCRTCDSVLHGEYMGKDGIPYCEKDYQKQFGVKCAYCSRYISGKVLQAGDNHHFHPTCARCTKCGDPFGDGEEMYLQGTAIWHPRCGPGPTENGTVLNGSLENGHCTDGESGKEGGRDFDRMSSSAVSEMQASWRY
ncbi:Actin-binding LIM protein 3 [Periplaneta americana]|uniref:Actin-binding LIM protein 3 n=1 Tax=Periplaneta americana TaxID=6978 RepID=A0ABQ8SG72_PERAM|nr:Actin-binding LIM protein 3 [Periplaneta americana]